MAKQLPLEKAGLKMLQNTEALNIDTILEMLAGWAKHCADSGDSNTASDAAFVDAVVEAVTRHETRHPNRQRHSPKQS